MKKKVKKNRKHPFLTVTQYMVRQTAAKIAKAEFREQKRKDKAEKAKENK